MAQVPDMLVGIEYAGMKTPALKDGLHMVHELVQNHGGEPTRLQPGGSGFAFKAPDGTTWLGEFKQIMPPPDQKK